jgi:hypothetical protein
MAYLYSLGFSARPCTYQTELPLGGYTSSTSFLDVLALATACFNGPMCARLWPRQTAAEGYLCSRRMTICCHTACTSSSPDLHESVQASVELLTSNRHLDGIEWVLHHEIRIQLVNLLQRRLGIRLSWLRKEQELDARKCLETLHAELRRLEDFDARGARVERCREDVRGGRGIVGGWVGAELASDCMHSVVE